MLSRLLYRHIVGSDNVTLQVVSGTEIQAVKEGNHCDIGIGKQAFLALFNEGHSYFNQGFPTTRQIQQMDTEEQEQVYFASLSLLVTTNDHNSAWRCHKAVFFELKDMATFGENEPKVACALATSRFERVNKSPALFAYIRQLPIADPLWLLGQMVRSLHAHKANYPAGYTIQWLINKLQQQNTFEKWRDGFADKLRAECHQCLTDATAWMCLRHCLGDTSAEFEWLLSVECRFVTPYRLMMQPGCVAKAAAALQRAGAGTLFAAALNQIISSRDIHVIETNGTYPRR